MNLEIIMDKNSYTKYHFINKLIYWNWSSYHDLSNLYDISSCFFGFLEVGNQSQSLEHASQVLCQKTISTNAKSCQGHYISSSVSKVQLPSLSKLFQDTKDP